MNLKVDARIPDGLVDEGELKIDTWIERLPDGSY
jgi:hypothetical protein